MENAIPSKSVSDLIVRKNPLDGTLQAIVGQLTKNEAFALARIWLIKRGDICKACPMLEECPDQNYCLHLIASRGISLNGKKKWDKIDGKFQRFPLGVRKVGFVAQTGESVLLDELQLKESDWIRDKDWIIDEKIVAFAAYPLKFQDDTFGVLAIFSHQEMNRERFEWLKVYAEQASLAIANARAFEELETLRQTLEDENEYLREEVSETGKHRFLIGTSSCWQKVLRQIELVGTSDSNVLITGESGTGKELVAGAIHEASERKNKPLVKVNCAAISSELFESEFFGHIRGAFTGAFKDRAGRFQVADGGTIFLDEIGEVPLALQGKLLRVLQEKQFEKVGEDRTRTVDVRVIAATNRDLADEVANGNFRQDLFYRLTVFPIQLPPLRERLDDIELLTRHFLKKFCAKQKCEILDLTHEDIRLLKDYWYPGNVRELENIVERAVILSQCRRLSFTMPQIINQMIVQENPIQNESGEKILTYQELKDFERENITRALKKANYKIHGNGGAAELLGSKPTTLISRIKALVIPMRP